MEWSKIKNILIGALILTNLLFIGLIIYSQFKESAAADFDYTKEILNNLSRNGITVNTELPQPEKDMPILTLYYDSENGTETITLQAGTDISNRKQAEKATSEYLDSLNIKTDSGCSLKIGRSEYDAEKNLYYINYDNYYNDYQIENSYIHFTVSASGIISVDRQLAYAEENGSRQEIISPETALLKYMNRLKTEDPEADISICDISIVYMVDSPYSGNITSDTAFPTWKIESDSKETVYIPAYK